MSTISSPITTLTVEGWKSNSVNPPELSSANLPVTHTRSNKRPRQENGASTSKFKGVVVQLNGNWGAQIYANNQRVWLGTFKSENEAASAYDSAAIRLRWGDAHKNFAWTNETQQEPLFQERYTTEAILQMIKDGSYSLKFSDFLTSKKSQEERKTMAHDGLSIVNKGYVLRKMFKKELTPSDVGKLNRLVIPKKYALRHFPLTYEDQKGGENNETNDTLPIFQDMSMRTWKFQYCYRKSSQNYVLARGWSRYVKENKLKEKDMIIFSMCECLEGHNKGHKFFMIGVACDHQVDRNHHIGIKNQRVIENDVEPRNSIDTVDDEKNIVLGGEDLKALEKSIRIFGVDITLQKNN